PRAAALRWVGDDGDRGRSGARHGVLRGARRPATITVGNGTRQPAAPARTGRPRDQHSPARPASRPAGPEASDRPAPRPARLRAGTGRRVRRRRPLPPGPVAVLPVRPPGSRSRNSRPPGPALPQDGAI